MRSNSAWISKTRANTITNTYKVQSSNTTADVNIGIKCKIDKNQIVYSLPNCQVSSKFTNCSQYILDKSGGRTTSSFGTII